MRNTHVTGPAGEDTGCWGVGYTGAPLNDVLIQALSYGTSTQTRIRLHPAEALRLAAAMADGAAAVVAGLRMEMGASDEPWLVSVDADPKGRVLLALHDEEGANGDRRTELAVPLDDALDIVEDLTERATRMLRDRCGAAAGPQG